MIRFDLPRRPSPALDRDAPADLNPLVYAVARPARAALPQTRVGEAIEILRSGPYRAVPVIDETDGARLLGMVSESALVAALLDAPHADARARIRQQPVADFLSPALVWVSPSLPVRDAAALFDQTGLDTLPVLDTSHRLLGLIARSDLVQELVRPFRPPVVGGMATPTGVYLTTGAVSGGVGNLALVGGGLAMFAAQIIASLALQPLLRWTTTPAPAGHGIAGAFVAVAGDVVPLVLHLLVFLLIIRLSPVAGYHAAEHQVVHAIERAEPLLIENVRAMPRVHPRCGTNIVAGFLILSLLGATLQPFLALASPPLANLSYALSAIVALAYWRTLGGWLQRWATTRPATDRQLQSGIRAAREVLAHHGQNAWAPPRPHVRLWRMGFLQILAGFAVGFAVLQGVMFLFPAATAALKPFSLQDIF